jgi:hypothetical protein
MSSLMGGEGNAFLEPFLYYKTMNWFETNIGNVEENGWCSAGTGQRMTTRSLLMTRR